MADHFHDATSRSIMKGMDVWDFVRIAVICAIGTPLFLWFSAWRTRVEERQKAPQTFRLVPEGAAPREIYLRRSNEAVRRELERLEASGDLSPTFTSEVMQRLARSVATGDSDVRAEADADADPDDRAHTPTYGRLTDEKLVLLLMRDRESFAAEQLEIRRHERSEETAAQAASQQRSARKQRTFDIALAVGGIALGVIVSTFLPELTPWLRQLVGLA